MGQPNSSREEGHIEPYAERVLLRGPGAGIPHSRCHDRQMKRSWLPARVAILGKALPTDEVLLLALLQPRGHVE